MSDIEGIGDRVRKLRKGGKMTQDALLEKVRTYAEGRKVVKESLSRIENNRQRPSAWMLEALANALDTTTDYLMGLADDPGINVPALPVPAMDIASLVAKLNDLPEEIRAVYRESFELLLNAHRVLMREGVEEYLTALFEDASPEEQEILRRAAERARVKSGLRILSATSDAEQEPGDRSGHRRAGTE